MIRRLQCFSSKVGELICFVAQNSRLAKSTTYPALVSRYHNDPSAIAISLSVPSLEGTYAEAEAFDDPAVADEQALLALSLSPTAALQVV